MKNLQVEAEEFLGSMRGQYIVSQALCIAVKEMSKVKEPHTEHSNIADMNYLLETLFPIYRLIEGVEDKAKKELAKMGIEKSVKEMKPEEKQMEERQAKENWCLNLKENDENTACANCKVKIGVVPISDENNTYWICEDCDSKMGWENG